LFSFLSSLFYPFLLLQCFLNSACSRVGCVTNNSGLSLFQQAIRRMSVYRWSMK
jgi:hypothetical protein